jgi:mitochondrial chaperone BCS1
MWETISELIVHNQLLVAGIGTVAAGYGAWAFRAIPSAVYGIFRRSVSIDVSTNTNNSLYDDLLVTLSKYRTRYLNRNYGISEDGEIVAGFGSSTARYHGKWIVFRRALNEKGINLTEQLHLTLMSRDTRVLQKLVTEAKDRDYGDSVKIYSSVSSYWGSPIYRRKRPLDTIFIDQHVKDMIIDRINWFVANEEWYHQRGIPYKLVFMLHGVPGTGKTSLIYGMASLFSRKVCIVRNLNNIDSMLRNLPDNAFAVIEDIDMLSTSRDKSEDIDDGDEYAEVFHGARVTVTSGSQNPPMPADPNRRPKEDRRFEDFGAQSALANLHLLVNTLDGIGTPPGLIAFVTTNHKERLDHALVRRGRVDYEFEIGALGPRETVMMFTAFYGKQFKNLVEAFVISDDFVPMIGADLQVMFMTNDNPLEALRLMRKAKLEAAE